MLFAIGTRNLQGNGGSKPRSPTSAPPPKEPLQIPRSILKRKLEFRRDQSHRDVYQYNETACSEEAVEGQKPNKVQKTNKAEKRVSFSLDQEPEIPERAWGLESSHTPDPRMEIEPIELEVAEQQRLAGDTEARVPHTNDSVDSGTSTEEALVSCEHHRDSEPSDLWRRVPGMDNVAGVGVQVHGYRCKVCGYPRLFKVGMQLGTNDIAAMHLVAMSLGAKGVYMS